MAGGAWPVRARVLAAALETLAVPDLGQLDSERLFAWASWIPKRSSHGHLESKNPFRLGQLDSERLSTWAGCCPKRLSSRVVLASGE